MHSLNMPAIVGRDVVTGEITSAELSPQILGATILQALGFSPPDLAGIVPLLITSSTAALSKGHTAIWCS